MDALKRFFRAATAPFSGLRPTPAPCMQLEPSVSPPAKLAKDPTLSADAFCMPSARIEPILRHGDMRILQVKKCASGVAGAQIVYLDFPNDGLVVKAKWKEAMHGGMGLNNEPRKELAAYLLQKWFLDADEYVVPPTVCRAVPLAHYTAAVRATKPTFDHTDFAFGLLAYWCDHVEEMKPFDAARFDADPAYRDTVANMNLLCYLIDHRDTRPANFVFSTDAERPRALSIDNGLAFSGLINPRVLFVSEWRHLVVPKLPRAKVERLRRIGRCDLDRLAVAAQHEVRADDLRSVDPGPLVGDPTVGVRREGDIIQLGLTSVEIDHLEDRVQRLLADVDQSKIELY